MGEPCTPFTLVKNKVVDGVVEKKTSLVYGRKIPLVDIRIKLLQKQEKFMRLLSEEEIDSMSLSNLRSFLSENTEELENLGLDCVQNVLKSQQRTRHLALWHDHSHYSRGWLHSNDRTHFV